MAFFTSLVVFFTLLIGKRLGYRTVVYAEWDARWYRWLDHFVAMKSEVITKVPQQYHHKFTVVGDLMADVVLEAGKDEEVDGDGGVEESGEDLVLGLLQFGQ